MIKLASWNVNSLKVRLDQVMDWLNASQVDILALQETKLVDEQFPLQVFKEQGFEVAFSGQKTYNGVALISRSPLTDLVMDIPHFADPQRRVLAATIAGIRVINVYVPNGSHLGSDKYDYKLAWLAKTRDFIQQQLQQYPRLAVVGDFNIAPEDCDVHDPLAWEGSVLVSALERQALADIIALGLVDSFRHFTPQEKVYSWWDYRGGSFRRNLGLRIDLILLSKALHQDCVSCQIDPLPRKSERPSDHAPVLAVLL